MTLWTDKQTIFFPRLFTRKRINEKLNVADYCACSSGDQDWYRGLIRELDSNGNAIVFKIDYGDVQCISVQFLRPLEVKSFEKFIVFCLQSYFVY